MLHFQYLQYLLVLATLPLIIFSYQFVIRWKKNTVKRIGDPELVHSLISEYSPVKFRIKYFLIIGAFVLCAFALAGLVIPDQTQRLTRNGTDLMIALDVSKSMDATDIKPSRIERAKQLISKIIDNLPDERVGLVVFAGRAYLQMPITIDLKAAKMYVSSVSTNDVPTQGTVISSALRMSMSAFNPQDKSFKSVLLISDGEDHDPDAEKAAKELAAEGIMVNTIGIGSPMGAPIPDELTGQYKTDRQGNTVISKLNEQELQQIAAVTHGVYQLYSSPELIVKNLKNQLAQIEKGDMMSDSSYLSLKQYYWYFLIGAFVLLITEMLISEKRRTLKSALVLSLFMTFSVPSSAQSANNLIIDGNKSFDERKYDIAEDYYRRALDKKENNDIASFNLGNTLYREDKLDDAVKAYDQAISKTNNNSIRQSAFYNKGVAYQKANKLDECILAYKNALLLNPNDEEARQNLQRALKQQQQQQQDNSNQDKKQKQNNQSNNQQKPQPQQPKPRPSAISRKDADEKLKALADKERELQDRLHKMRSSSSDNPEKDW